MLYLEEEMQLTEPGLLKKLFLGANNTKNNISWKRCSARKLQCVLVWAAFTACRDWPVITMSNLQPHYRHILPMRLLATM